MLPGMSVLLTASILHDKAAVPNLFGIRDWFHGRQFSHEWGREWFVDDSSTFHLLCTLFLLLLHQLQA